MLSLYDGANGVKTGYTGNAGRCLVTSATKNGRTLIAVVLGCGTKKQRTEDSIKLLNYGFENFEIVDICSNMKKEFEICVNKGKYDRYKIVLSGSYYMAVEKEKIDKISYKYEKINELNAPIPKGEYIGKISIYLEKEKIKEIIINMPQNIEKKTFFDYFQNLSKINVEKYEIRL